MRLASVLSVLLLSVSSTANAAPPAGEPWGPCLDGGLCFTGFCAAQKIGNICAPECDTTDCTKVQVECGGLVGDGTAECLADGVCVNECASDDDCAGSQLCAADGFCVWPMVESGGALGPCDGACDGFCVETEVGSVCLPICGYDKSTTEMCPPIIDACGDNVSPVCAPTGACELPCDALGECFGVAGMVCDKDVDLCVWP